jgi:isoleucyl-tRNA synthetase
MRNTARFLLANTNGFDPAQHLLAPTDMLMLDRWAVARAAQLQDEVTRAYETYEFHHIYQKVHNFCANDLGGFYLDVIKDRQYTTQPDSVARRSAQTAMYHIVEALARWLAPILSFTAEEIWRNLPGEHDKSVLLSTWSELPEMFPAGDETAARFDTDYWQDVLVVREAVGKELEKLRVAGDIGSSLDAEVDLYCDDAWREKLGRLEDELRFVLITSYARLHPLDEQPAEAVSADLNGAKLGILVRPSEHTKCVRCWHHREDVGTSSQHPELCGRCIENIDGDGESRHFA